MQESITERCCDREGVVHCVSLRCTSWAAFESAILGPISPAIGKNGQQLSVRAEDAYIHYVGGKQSSWANNVKDFVGFRVPCEGSWSSQNQNAYGRVNLHDSIDGLES